MNHKDAITCLLDLKNGDIASGSLDTTIKIWDPITGKCKRTLKGHTHAIIVLLELEDSHLVSSALDQTLVIWDVQTGVIFNTLEGFEQPITQMVKLPNDVVAMNCNEFFFLCWEGVSDKKENL